MASITSLYSGGTSSTSSIYGNRNILSGLASGMDTEAMIENAVSGIKTKIASLQQDQTMVQWEQEAYRSIIDKMAGFLDKYTSYTSSTNLFSSTFFNGAVTTSTGGEFKDKVTASGRTGSDVQILGVKQLASAATYKVEGNSVLAGSGIITAQAIDVTGDTFDQSNISGSLTINVGNRSIVLAMDDKVYKTGQELADAFNEKLKESNKDDYVTAKWDEAAGALSFEPTNTSDSVYIENASGDIAETLGIEPGTLEDGTDTITISDPAKLYTTKTRDEVMKEGELNFALDGVSKKIDMSEFSGGNLADWLQSKLNDAFGSGKITVGDIGTSGKTQLTFDANQKGSTLQISGSAAESMGLGDSTRTNYLDTATKLGDILTNFDWDANRVEVAADEVTVDTEDSSKGTDKNGNAVKLVDSKWYRVDKDGNYMAEFKVNGQVVGCFGKESAMESVINAIDSSADANVSVSYSKTTNQFFFTADEAGVAGRIDFDSQLSSALFGGKGTYTEGKDAIVTMSVNGEKLENVTRSSNSFNVDGLTINLKGTFNYEAEDVKVVVNAEKGWYQAAADDEGYILDADGKRIKGSGGNYVTTKMGTMVDADGNLLRANGNLFTDAAGRTIQCGTAMEGKLVDNAEAVTFDTSTDADKIVEAVKAMVTDYNAMVTEIKKAYSTMPAENSKGNRYEPLTDEDREDMSESAIKAYEEKAKQGILFGDSDLYSLSDRLRSAITSAGSDNSVLRSIGINTSYGDGLTTISLDESALRSALESDPDKVRDAFTKSTANGSSSNGLMQNLKTTLEAYGKVTGTKGILVEKAGSIKAPVTLNNNALQKKIDNLDNQIDRWQEKLSDKVDYYTRQFTLLEKLISEMNSQSSNLAGLMGGY